MSRLVLPAALPGVLYAAAGAAAEAWTRVARLSSRDVQRRRQLAERLGDWAPVEERDSSAAGAARACTIWVHAASVGEVGVANRVAAAVRAAMPAARMVLTCNTATGRAAADDVFEEVRSLPLDRGPVVRKVLDRVVPALYVFVETEIWPVLLLELASRRVPAVMVNARISDRSFPRYRLGVGLLRPALGSLAAVCVRDADSAKRLVALGAPAAVTRVTGDIKSERAATSPERPASMPLLDLLGARPPVLVAGSVRPAEIAAVAEAYGRVRRTHPGVRLVLAPRYLEDCDSAVAVAERTGAVVVRRSVLAGPYEARAPRDWDVLVLDTMGELASIYEGAVGAFVGGTLDGTGGHSLVEPAASGLALVAGAALSNVREQARELEACGALERVENATALAGVWCSWLDDPKQARRRGARARACVERSVGALCRTLDVLEPLLEHIAMEARA